MTGGYPDCTAVSAPSDDAGWEASLHWIIRVLPVGHPDLAFAASLLSFEIERGLTERQEKYARRLLERVKAEQPNGGNCPAAAPVDLAGLPTAGRT